jgi:large subunit ribosomal protein L25
MPSELNVEKRISQGSAESRRLRRAGSVPAVLYGRGAKEEMLSVAEKEFMKTIGYASSGIVKLLGLGKPVSVLVKEIQWDSLTDKPVHIDFYRVALDQIVSVKVPLHLEGSPRGALFGGVLDQLMYELPIRVKAADIPPSVTVNVNELDIGDVLHVSDLIMPAGVTPDVSGELAVVLVAAPTVEKTKAAEEGEEGAEGAEPAEGEEAAGKKPAEKKEDKE